MPAAMRRAGRSWPAWGACISYGIAASAAKRYLGGLPALVTATGSQMGAALGLALPVLFLGEAVTAWMLFCASVIVIGTSLSTGLFTTPAFWRRRA